MTGAAQSVVVLALALALSAVGLAVASVQDLEREADAALLDGRYQEAERLLLEVLEDRPRDQRALYNLACCASRLGRPDDAREWLEAAWKAGFRDLELIRSDPDLEGLRATRGGQRLVGRLEAEAEQERLLHGEPLLFDAPTVASIRVVVPQQSEAGEALPLVVLLHGHGGAADRVVGAFSAAGLSPGWVVAAPYGPHPIAHANGIGYSWYPPLWLYEQVVRGLKRDGGDVAGERRELARHEQEVGESYVLAAIEAVSREYPVDEDRVFLIGHSEGGALAYGLGLGQPERFCGVAVIGARLPARNRDQERLAAAAGRISVLVCHSPEDRAVAFEEAKLANQQLNQAGIDSRLLRYSGGHGLTVQLMRSIARWIGRLADSSPSGE